ncbi:Ig-like domain-containing protein, partial [Halopseudomonas xiamenensis]
MKSPHPIRQAGAPARSGMSLICALEPRMLFDGAVAATVADVAEPVETQPNDTHANDNLAATPQGSTDQRHEVVFIDSNVRDYQQLLAGMPSSTEVVILDGDQDGLQQMADYLQGRSGIDAIHILSHGDIGRLQLGSQWLDNVNLPANAELLTSIGQALTADGDILLYGCQVGANGAGADFLQALATATGADVAASTDATGAAALGGDWVLEAQSGAIESDALVLAGYQGLLAAPTSESFDGIPVTDGYSLGNSPRTINGWTISLLDGSGAVIVGNDIGNWIDVTQLDWASGGSSLSGTGDGALSVQGYYGQAAAAQFKATSGDEFWLQSFTFQNGNAASNLRVVGYRDGVEVASQDFTETANDTTFVTVTLDHASDQDWQNIDEFRIVQQNGSADILFYLDDLTVGAAMLPNAVPTIGNLDGDSTTFTEGGSAVLLDAGSNATVTDTDSTDFDGGNVTVAITANGTTTEDVLGIRNQGMGAGQIGVSGTSVTYGGTAIGTVAGGTNGVSLVVTLNASATPTAVSALLQNLTYANGNTADPNTAARTVSITVNDGDGGTSTAAEVTVNVTDVNDAPTVTATGNNPTYTENGSAVDLFSNVSINTVETGQTITGMTLSVTNLADGSNEILRIDGTDILLVDGSGVTTGNGISYSVSLVGGTATISLSSAGGISAATAQNVVDGMGYRNSSDAPSTATRVIILTSITDSGGTANGGVDTTSPSIISTVSVVAVNDAPTLSGGPYSLTGTNEDTISNGTLVSTILAGLTTADPDGPGSGIAITASSGNGTWQYSTDGITWSGIGSVSSSSALLLSASTQVRYIPDGANGETVTLTFRAWDQSIGSASTNAMRSSADTSTNGGTTAFSSGTAQASLLVAAVNDAPTASNLTQTVSYNEDPGSPVALGDIVVTDVDTGETITAILTLSNPSAGNLTTGTFGSATSTYNAGTGVWAVSGSVSDVNAALAAVAFAPAANWSQDVTINTHIRDAAGTGPIDGTITLDVTAINDAPTITAPGSIAITEDVAGALTGISFTDVDAGSGNVTATFSVPSGTLSAISGNGVTVGGTASALTLTGSLADINAFIAASGISFTTASNATANVTLTVTIDDGGNTGSGGAQTDTTSVTLMVTAVNDAPVNSVPTAQNVDQDDDLVFNSANGNMISISDVDAGASNVEVTLAATNGLLTLGGTTGLSFTVGSGSNAATMTFYGSIADINNALNGLVFSPTGGYNGPASLQITTNDLGNSGSGGAQTDTDTISITVNSLIPQVTDVSASTADGIYKVGDTITITATFSEAVTVDTTGGIPTLLLETGSVDRLATYISGSGGNTLTFIYTVQPGDLSADLNYQSTAALSLNGATIRGVTANDAVLTLPSLGDANSLAGNKAIVIDGVAATVSSVSVPADGTYVAGQNLDFTVNLSESVTVDTSGGTPRIAITLDTGGTVYASYLSGSGSTALVFRLTVADGQMDSTGISLGSSIDANGGTLRDVAGNDTTTALNTVGSTTGVLVDAIIPEVSAISLDGASPTNASSVTFTVTFTEDVSGVDISDFSLVTDGSVNATLQSLIQIDPRTYRVTIDAITGLGNLGLSLNANGTGIVDAANNSITGGFTDGPAYAIDTIAPTAPVVTSPALTNAAAPVLSGTAEADSTVTVTIGGATYTTVAAGGTWSLDLATATPAAGSLALNTNGANPVSVTATDAAGNVSSATTQTLVIDTQRPTASIVVSDPTLSLGETTTVTVTFSEAVAGLTVSDFAVANGSLSDLSSSDGGITWTATLTPDANVEDTSNLITLDNTGYIDAAGNTGTGSTDSNAYAIDTLRPTATIVVSDTALSVGETTTVTITFSEAVSGLTIEDFAVANGALSELVSIDGGITWTATLTPDANIEDTSNLITLDNTGYTDAAGNTGSGTTDSNSYAIDTQRPTASIVVSDTALSVGETSTVTITFSEAVSGLTVSDFAIANGTLSGLSSSDGGITWTATLTPDANIEDTSNLITLDNTGYIDAAGNTGTGTTDSNNYAIDTQRPTASIVVSDTALAAGETTTVTITFSEAVSGLDTADFSVANGSLSGLSSSDGGITWTATLTPDANIEDTSNLITLDNTGVTDLAGNAGSGTTDSNSYAIDTQRPTASIVVSDTALSAGETATVTVTFSEAVTGLTTADFSVANGSLSGLSSSDGGVTWTATLTPNTNIEDTSNLITLDNTGYTDAAGNTGSGTTDSNNYAIDTQRPTASIVVSDTALAAGETATVTITFSEAVTGLTTADFSVANGSLSGLSSSDGGVTWTATLTPDTNIEDTDNLITLDNTGYTDAAGNTGSGTTDSNNYAIDTQRPTASIVVSDTALAVGETATVTITFSEAVTGLTTADFSIANGSLSGLSSSDGGITWTATLTPDTNIEDTSNLITLDNTGVQDAAGNSGTGTTDSNSYAIDTQRPAVVSIVVGDLALAAGETTTVTITFSEVVSGLDLADFTVANATLSGLSSSDGGITWTATLTPSANVENAANLITLNNAGYTDVAGNTGSGTTDSNSYAIDTLRPTASIVVSDTALAVGETSTITITFSEAVTGLDLADFSVA